MDVVLVEGFSQIDAISKWRCEDDTIDLLVFELGKRLGEDAVVFDTVEVS